MPIFQKLLDMLKLQGTRDTESGITNEEIKRDAEVLSKQSSAISHPRNSSSALQHSFADLSANTNTHITSFNASHKEYAIALLLKNYGNASPLPDYYPQYYSRECGLTNPALLHQQLISEGYLVRSSILEELRTLKITELKQILQSCGLKVTGKKAELVDRILTNVDVEDLHSFFQSETPCYSLSAKGTEFLKNHEDYIRFHRYTKFGISFDEYERTKTLLSSTTCEETLIFLYTQKKNNDKYNRLYHVILSQLYDANGDPANALHEFLIVKYFDINYINAFQWLNNELQYTNTHEATQRIFESQKNCNALSPENVAYIVRHSNVYSRITVDNIYREYPLDNLLVTESQFCSMISEMEKESFFDVSKWNNYFLRQLKYNFKL